MTAKRRLPVLVEKSIGSVQALRSEVGSKFEMLVRGEASKSNKPITCSAGCASCCYHPITISILEGILIYRWLVKNGRWSLNLQKKLKETSDQQYGTSYEVWLFALIPCPLLDEEKRCSVYAARPLICRTYYATGDPHYCHPHRLGPYTRIVDRKAVTDTYHTEQERILRENRLQFLTMPIGAALLLADRVCKGEIDLGGVDRILLNEYTEKA
jgi:Fe-S-cluster containining protein